MMSMRHQVEGLRSRWPSPSSLPWIYIWKAHPSLLKCVMRARRRENISLVTPPFLFVLVWFSRTNASNFQKKPIRTYKKKRLGCMKKDAPISPHHNEEWALMKNSWKNSRRWFLQTRRRAQTTGISHHVEGNQRATSRWYCDLMFGKSNEDLHVTIRDPNRYVLAL